MCVIAAFTRKDVGREGVLACLDRAWTRGPDLARTEETPSGWLGFRRLSTAPYRCETFLIPIEEVMLGERVLPAEYLNAAGTDVTQEFVDWCRPLIGPELPHMARLL